MEEEVGGRGAKIGLPMIARAVDLAALPGLRQTSAARERHSSAQHHGLGGDAFRRECGAVRPLEKALQRGKFHRFILSVFQLDRKGKEGGTDRAET